MKIEHIIDEAPFKPEYWRYICDHISSVTGGAVCLISRSGAKPHRNRVVSSSVMGGDRLLIADTGASAFAKKLISSSHGGFVRDVDVLTPTELEDDPYRKHVLQPIGYTWQLGCLFSMPFGQSFMVEVLRPGKSGPFSSADVLAADNLRELIWRSIMLASRVAVEAARHSVEALGRINMPAATIDSGGLVVSANSQISRLAPSVVVRIGDQIRVHNEDSQDLLAKTISVITGQGAPTAQSIAVASAEGVPPLVLTAMPISTPKGNLFSSLSALIIAGVNGQFGPPSIEVLRGLFDFTLSEAKIAFDLASGLSLTESSAKNNLTPASARTYVKRILNKTGTGQQSELVALLIGMGTPSFKQLDSPEFAEHTSVGSAFASRNR